MKYGIRKVFLLIFFLPALFFVVKVSVSAAVCSLDAINACGKDATCFSAIGDQCKRDRENAHSQANTLANQIAQFNYQINLTTLQIAQTEQKIVMLGGRIGELETSLDNLTKAFSSRAVETYKLSRFENNFTYILTASDINDAVARFHYLKKVQEADTNLLEKLQEAQTTYKGQKADQETLQKQLQVQQANLSAQKVAKANLLAATQNDESRYLTLLSVAQAQLAALSSFAESVGIQLIPHQDLSDDWGKYYNQRDEQWGNVVANNSYDCVDSNGNKVACTIARVGCLIASYAMVVTHYGGLILPSEVALNPSNFYLATALFNSPGPSANGHNATDVSNPSMQDLRDALNSGKVVIAGLSVNGGPYPSHYSDHWVVLRSVDGDSFRINDPEYPGAMNISLNDHYSGWTIIQAKIYQ